MGGVANLPQLPQLLAMLQAQNHNQQPGAGGQQDQPDSIDQQRQGLMQGAQQPGMQQLLTGGGSVAGTQLPATQAKQLIGPKASPASVINPTSPMGMLVNGIHSLAVRGKQKQFEKEKFEGTLVAAGSALTARQEAGEKLNSQELAILKQYQLFDGKTGKAAKIAEQMVLPDSGKGYYAGAALFNQKETERINAADDRKEKLAKTLADAAYHQAVGMAALQNAGTKKEALTQKQTEDQNKLVQQGALRGMNVTFDEQGKVKETPFTQEEINSNPMLKAQQARENAATNALVERAKEGPVKLQLERERLGMQKRLLDLRAVHESKLPNQANAPKLSTQEQNRMDMAQIAQDYLGEMQEILKRRPDLFGSGGWGQNAMAKAMADQDPDAARWSVLSDLTKQPMIAMHFRSQQAMKDMDDMNSSFYRSPESVAARLDEELKGTQRIKTTAGRPDGKVPGGKPSTIGAPKSGDSSTDPFAEFGGKAR